MSFLVLDAAIKSEIISIQDVVDNKMIRLSRWSSRTIIAIRITILYICVLPKGFYYLYVYLTYEDKFLMFVGGITIIAILTNLQFEIFLSIIYKYNISYIEQYKLWAYRPWPWDNNPKEYKLHYKRL